MHRVCGVFFCLLFFLFLVGITSCSDFLGDDDGGLTEYLDPTELKELPPPGCKAVALSTSKASPFEKVEVDLEFENFDPTAFGVELRLDQEGQANFFLPVYRNDQGYFFSAPVHPDGIDGGLMHLHFTDGEVSCDDEISFVVEALDPAPGSLQDLIDNSSALARALAASFGYDVDDLIDADVDDLPAPLIPLAIQLWTLNHPDNPDSLQAHLDNNTLPVDHTDEDLQFAEAVLAASGHLDNLVLRRQAVEDLVADNPDLDIDFSTPTNLLQGKVGQTQQGLCSVFNGPMEVKIGNYRELSYYMRKARRAESHGERVERVGLAVGLLGTIPGPSAVVAAIISLVLAVDTLMTSAHANLYPRELTAPEVEDLQTDFNEDFLTRGNWGPYRVTAVSPGWDAPADIMDALISAIFAISSLPGGVSSPSANVADSLDQYLRKFLETSADTLGDEFIDSISNFVFENAASVLNQEILGDSGLCVITPGPWPDIGIHQLHWLDIEYHGAVTGLLGDHAVEVCRDGPLPTERSEYEPISTGAGGVVITASQDHFPTATDPLGSRLVEAVTVHEINVLVDPRRRVAFPGDTIELSGIIENAHNQRGQWHYPDAVEVLDTHTPSDDRQRIELTLPQSDDDFPVFLLLSSRAQTGLRDPLCSPPVRAELISIQNEIDLEITPRHRCIPEGGSLQLKADLAYPDPTARVDWSAGAGTIDDTGYFQAPSTSGEVTIEATVAGTDLEDRVQIRVGECGCFFDAQVSGGGLNLRLSSYGGMFAYEQDGAITIKMADHDQGLGATLQGYLDSGEYLGSIPETPEFGLAGTVVAEGDMTLHRHLQGNAIQGSFSGTGAHLGEFLEFLHIGEHADVYEYQMSIHFMVPLASGIGALLPNDDCSPP